jgi:hypothetical protein
MLKRLDGVRRCSLQFNHHMFKRCGIVCILKNKHTNKPVAFGARPAISGALCGQLTRS